MEQKLPKSIKQTIKIFEEFIRKESVQDFVIKLRKELNIPVNGIPYEKIDEEMLSREEDYFMFYIPIRFEKPIWKNFSVRKQNQITLLTKIQSFLLKQEHSSPYMSSMLRLYFFFNKTITNFPIDLLADDLIKLEYIPSKLDFYEGLDSLPGSSKISEPVINPKILKSLYQDYKIKSEAYPIAIYINPEAGQNQIKSFISKNWGNIIKHRSTKKITRLRTKRRQEVSDLIYKHRKLSPIKIRKMLAQEMNEYLDDGHIRQIIQLEIKKRN